MSPDPRVEVALAEFNGLRAEILSRHASQTALIGVCLTAIAVAFGLVLSEKAAPEQVLLVVPAITSGLSLFYTYHTRMMLLIGRYFREELWPRLIAATGCPAESWETYLQRYRNGTRFRSVWQRLRYMSPESIGGAAVFVLPGVVALVAFHPAQALDGSPMLLAAWLLDATLMALQVAVALALARDHVSP